MIARSVPCQLIGFNVAYRIGKLTVKFYAYVHNPAFMYVLEFAQTTYLLCL